MIYVFLRLWRIKWRDCIPRLPSRMYASKYDSHELTDAERRVMARLGIRDPAGMKAAMKRYRVKSPEALIALLEHQQPQRRFWAKVRQAFGRLSGGYEYEPHLRDLAAMKRRQMEAHSPIAQRVKDVQRWFK